MANYVTECPYQHGLLITHEVAVKEGRDKKVKYPLFYCKKCNKYFINIGGNGTIIRRTKPDINGVPVFIREAPICYDVPNPVPYVAKKPTISRRDTYGGSRYAQGYSSVEKNNGEHIIRIHKLKKEEIDAKLQTNFNNIRMLYPKLTAEQMTINDLIAKVFPGSIAQSVVVRNETSAGNKGTLIRRVELYNKNSSYLGRHLPKGTYLAFGGKVTNGELYITEIRIWENPILKGDDIEAKVTFLYDGPNRANWLYDVTEKVAGHTEEVDGELADWNAYLDWKRQLAELRIQGMKYIGFRLNVEEEEVTFLVVSEGKAAFDGFHKYLMRNETSVFSNYYSNNEWYFEFNRDYQELGNNDDAGVALSFVRIAGTYGMNDVDYEAWDVMRPHTKKYIEKSEESSTRQMLGGISRSYFEPYFAEVVFELSTNAMQIINRQIRQLGNLTEDIEEILAKEFYGDGYIATSQVGDFALLKRLKQAVIDLANGKTASQGLDQWLFDIKKARKPENIEKIMVWQNASLNERQKEAVEKILSAPDICLIQGPPGTGKTTVIAEAIYQLVIRNKRVLVASQANLAVDNALERLISNPKIRAIRLGNSKKIDSSVTNITEGNVLETFYDSILSYVNSQYVEKWNKVDKLKEVAKNDLYNYQLAVMRQGELANCIAKKKEVLEAFDSKWRNAAEYNEKNSLISQKECLRLLGTFCQGGIESLDFDFSKDTVVSIWNVLERYLIILKDKGLILTKVGIDVNEINNPQRFNRAIEIIKYIFTNCRLSNKVLEKLKNNEKFGGDSRELEELKIQEQLLREQLIKEANIECMDRWQKINQKIDQLSKNGAGLTDAELALFSDDILSSTEAEKNQQMISVLECTQPLLKQLLQDVEKCAEVQISLLDDELRCINEKVGAHERLKEQLLDEIEMLLQEEAKNINEAQRILAKYRAAKDNLEEVIGAYELQIEETYKTEVPREAWEDIFAGLQKWVIEIPDYEQEKSVFLKSFINGCNVVGVSCTENARTLTENGFDDFDVVIIDEVSKATPPELLIPMLRGRKVVLVGDHRQLPPLFNEHEKTYQEVAEQQENLEDVIVTLTMDDFNKYKDMVTASLFQEYFENASPSIKETLTYQYRMHTDIMDIINTFYDNHLQDGNEGKYTDDTKAHYLDIRSVSGTELIIPKRHAYWIDSSEVLGEKVYEQRKYGSTSAENLVEAEIIVELLRKMELQYANRSAQKTPVSIGVISFYYDQVILLRQMIRAESFHAINVEVNTVDRFQGKEKEIVFVSLVRNVKKSLHNLDSHIAAFQRINVAFSRAQNLLVIVGAKDMYANQPVKITDMNSGEEKVIMAYKDIIEMIDQKGAYFTSDEILSDVKAYEILQKLSTVGGNKV